MKFTAIIFIALLLAFSAGVSAQTYPSNKVLADGSGGQLTQSMADRLTDFFEWSLEVKFSGEERTEFQNEVAKSWESGNKLEIQGVFYILELSRDLENWDETKRQEAQILIKERFLKELERNDSNRINALLLAGYRQTHAKIDKLSTAVKQ
jgi:hypothetical protein